MRRRSGNADRETRLAPAEYTRIVDGGVRATVLTGAEAWAREAIRNTDGLYGWASKQADRSHFMGRGRVHVVPAPVPGPDQRSRWAVRHYRRGGAMAMHMGDRYLRLGRARPLRELEASLAARAVGIRTPAVVCGASYSDGLYYRADLITEVVPDVQTLGETLHEHDGTRGWLDAMARAALLIQQLTEACVFHVDLNAHNVLVTADVDEPAWVVDLDRARILGRPSRSARDRMVARLTRSIMKIGTPTGEALSHQEIESALTRLPG